MEVEDRSPACLLPYSRLKNCDALLGLVVMLLLFFTYLYFCILSSLGCFPSLPCVPYGFFIGPAVCLGRARVRGSRGSLSLLVNSTVYILLIWDAHDAVSAVLDAATHIHLSYEKYISASSNHELLCRYIP